METIGHPNIIQELQQLNDNLTFYFTESNDGQNYAVLTIKQNKEYQTLLDRLLKNEIIPQINKEIEGL